MTRTALLAVIAIVIGLLAAVGASGPTPTVFANVLVVTNTNDSGPGSLRSALDRADDTAGPDTVTFSIGGAGPHQIDVLSTILVQDEGTTIDATGSGIVVDGSSLAAPANLFQVAATSVAMKGFTIRNAPSNGVSVSPAFAGSCAGTVAAVFIEDMVFDGNGESGLLVCASGGAGVGVNRSDFTNNSAGVTVSGAIAGGTRVNNGRIAGNGVGINLLGAPAGTVNAQGNWWGCATGANTPGCDGASAGVDTSNFQPVDAIRVTNLNDSGSGSLRRAISEANTRPGPDVIQFRVSGVIALTGGGFPVTDDLTIDTAANSVVIDGIGMPSPNNVFEVTAPSFQLSRMTIINAPNNAVSLGATCGAGFTASLSMLVVEASGESGVSICTSGAVSVSLNEVRFNGGDLGVNVAGTTASSVTITNSQFNNQGSAAVANSATAGTVNAQGNWWGCADGAN